MSKHVLVSVHGILSDVHVLHLVSMSVFVLVGDTDRTPGALTGSRRDALCFGKHSCFVVFTGAELELGFFFCKGGGAGGLIWSEIPPSFFSEGLVCRSNSLYLFI